MKPEDVYLPEVLFELRQVGNNVRVMALDPLTGTEVVMVGDARQTKKTLKRNAMNKLRYVMAKKFNEMESQRNDKSGTR